MQDILGSYTSSDHPTLVSTTDTTPVYHFSSHGQDIWVAWLRADSGSATVNIDTGG